MNEITKLSDLAANRERIAAAPVNGFRYEEEFADMLRITGTPVDGDAPARNVVTPTKSKKLTEAEKSLTELQAALQGVRTLSPAIAELMFGGKAQWSQALSRMGIESGRRVGEVAVMRQKEGLEQGFELDEVARPLNGSGVRRTLD